MTFIYGFMIIYTIVFLVLYVGMYYFNLKKKNLGLNKGLIYICRRYNLKMGEDEVKKLTKILVLVNSFIISIPVAIVLFFEVNYFISLIMSFVIFIVLILSLYNIIGVILRKKGW